MQYQTEPVESLAPDLGPAFTWIAGLLDGEDPMAGLPEMIDLMPPSFWTIDGFARVRKIIGAASVKLASQIESGTGKHDPRSVWESERIRLFDICPGGVPAPPYGSWWMEGRLMGETTTAVARFYQEEQLAARKGLADYLPTELMFLSCLLARQGEEPDAVKWLRREQDFLDQFLLPWVPAFCVAGEKAGRIELWWHVLNALAELLIREHNRLQALASAP